MQQEPGAMHVGQTGTAGPQGLAAGDRPSTISPGTYLAGSGNAVASATSFPFRDGCGQPDTVTRLP
jgi:hypothetical protein